MTKVKRRFMRISGAVLPSEPLVAERLLAPEQAVIAYLGAVRLAPPGTERVPLDAALGRVLAEDARASEDHPAFARSTMDGFAVVAADGVAPRTIAGEILMGAPAPHALRPGQAMRIPTGGALPEGADAVIPLEDVDEADGRVQPHAAVEAGASVTPRASDMRAGEVVLREGRRIGAPELGVLATLGFAEIPVYRQPRFGIASTGDELIDPGLHPADGQIRDSNRFAIAGALRAMGAEAVHLPRARDDADALRAALRAALETCDGVIFTGGSSVGARDMVPQIVRELGGPGVVVHGLRVKPGKPTMLGAIGARPVIGLPGNPASALMILEAVVRPVVAACTGERGQTSPSISAVAAEAFAGREGWTWYVPAVLSPGDERPRARPLPLRSAQVSLLARASGYVVLGETEPRVEAGCLISVRLFSSGGAPSRIQ